MRVLWAWFPRSKKGSCLPIGRLRGCTSPISQAHFSAPAGDAPLMPHFSAMRNGGKNRLGRSPLRTSLGYEAAPASRLCPARDPCCGPCLCHYTRPPWAAGPMAGRFPRPGLPWKSGVPAAGSPASDDCQLKPPLCKGRWHGRSRDGGIVGTWVRQPLSQPYGLPAPLTQGSL